MPPCAHFTVTRHTAAQAVKMALPMIEQAVKNPQVGDKGFLYIVVMDPLKTPACCSFEQAILYEHAVGDVAQWDADYAGFARGKARTSWCTGTDSQIEQQSRPYLLTPHDTDLWGSSVLDGITVSVSGVNSWFDEAFAGCVAMCMRAVARSEHASVQENCCYQQ
jgi:hypothetical protein